jgi:hypothetical protein
MDGSYICKRFAGEICMTDSFSGDALEKVEPEITAAEVIELNK